jgi:LacI family transcriptional regulator, repressor for deo operon, udp, cdd, tsx, nupC, and nupG
VVLADAGNDRQWELASLAALRALTVDGYLFFEVEPPPGEPLRAVSVETLSDEFPVVRLDAEGGARAAVEHLQALGHTRIGHLASEVETDTFRLRLQAFDAAAGPGAPRALSAFTIDAARAAAGPLLAGADRPTAIFADDDILAAGVYLAAREAGLSVPGDVSVVGFDDLSIARLLEPELTTVAADAEALGAAAFEALLAVLRGEKPAPERIVPVSLVVRGSTGPPA